MDSLAAARPLGLTETRPYPGRSNVSRIHRFPSCGAFLEHVVAPGGIRPGIPGATLSSRKGPRSDWDLGAGWDGSLGLVRSGWTERTAATADMLRTLESRIQDSVSKTYRSIYSVRGSTPVVGRVLSGHPKPMRRKVRVQTNRPRPVVSIAVLQSYSGGLGADALAARGVALVALFDALRKAGRPFEAFLINGVAGRSHWTEKPEDPADRYYAEIPVVQAGQYVDPSALLFWFAHPAAFRRLGFSWLELDPVAREKIGVGYGYPMETLDPEETARFDYVFGGGMLGRTQWSDPAKATEWVREQLRDMGVAMDD